MSAFQLGADNDLAIPLNSRGKPGLRVETDPIIAGGIKLYNRLQLFLGEWFADKRVGVPYFQTILVKNPDPVVARQVLRQVILSVPCVVSVGKLQFDYDARQRKASFYFEALATDGRVIKGGSGTPFVIGNRTLVNQGV